MQTVCGCACLSVCVLVCVAMFAPWLTSAVWPCSNLCAPVSLSVCPVCVCQAHLAARPNRFWPWKLPQMSTVLNVKSFISVFVCKCMTVREQQHVHARVFKITWWTWSHVPGFISSTTPHFCQRRRAFHKEPCVHWPLGFSPTWFSWSRSPYSTT